MKKPRNLDVYGQSRFIHQTASSGNLVLYETASQDSPSKVEESEAQADLLDDSQNDSDTDTIGESVN